jgi:hypothetical protein
MTFTAGSRPSLLIGACVRNAPSGTTSGSLSTLRMRTINEANAELMQRFNERAQQAAIGR